MTGPAEPSKVSSMRTSKVFRRIVIAVDVMPTPEPKVAVAPRSAATPAGVARMSPLAPLTLATMSPFGNCMVMDPPVKEMRVMWSAVLRPVSAISKVAVID